MNKKFLSAILFGALMVTSTGTFVSCKDYDDDIDNLQEQIDKLATKEDMEAKLSQMQTAIDAAKSTAADALKKAEAAGNADEIAALKERISKLEKATIDVEALKKELKDAVNEEVSQFRDEMNKLIKKVTDLVGNISDIVTDVELVLTDGVDGATKLNIMTVTQKENEFGPNKEVKFTKDAQTNFGGKLVVRVSPTNAVLTADMISFINSNGQDLSNLITVGTPKKYEGGLLAKATAETGLWEIPYNWKTYTEADFKAAAYVDGTKGASEGNKILYAVAVDNTLATLEEARTVVSGYDLNMNVVEFEGSNELYFTAGGEKVTDLINRYGTPKNDKKWSGGAGVDVTKNTADDADDSRTTNKEYLSVKVGTPFDVVLKDKDGKDLANTIKPYRFYVTLDKDYAETASEPSEINAWNNYAKNTTGLNVLDTDGKVTISINDATAEGDIIGYRVYAVNYDGTLVDPDGKAFYVYVGTSTVASADLTLTSEIKTPYDWTKVNSVSKAEFSTASWARAKGGKYSIVITDPTQKNADVTITTGITYDMFTFYDKDNKEISNFLGTSTLIDDAKITAAKKVTLDGVDPAKLRDGVKYTATITAKNTAGATVATGVITFTKKLLEFPTTKVYPYTEALISNVLYVYPTAKKDKDNKAIGEFEMKNVWHGVSEEGDWKQSQFKQVDFTQVLTDAQKTAQGKGQYPSITYAPATSTVTINAKLVDPNNLDANKPLSTFYLKELPMVVTYNYGNISLPYNEKTATWATVAEAWKPEGTKFNIVFRNYAADCTINWDGEAPTLYYPGAEQKKDSIALSKLIVKDWYKNNVDLSKDTPYFDKTSVKVTLLTGENEVVDEYYEAKIKAAATYGTGNTAKKVPAQIIFTSQVNKAQGNPVPTKIKVVIVDKFGYEVSKVVAPFTMKFQKD